MFKTKIRGPLLAVSALAFMLVGVVAPSTASADVNVYTTPGYHKVNGRSWSTTCEAYSRTTRCRTEIWSTEIRLNAQGKLYYHTGWHFNNLTYLPSPRALWKGNPLGNTGRWTASNGVKWRTECDTATTGRNGCRSYIWQGVPVTVGYGAGTTTHAWEFNNIVMFG